MRNALIIACLTCLNKPSFGQKDTLPDVNQLLRLSLEELMNVKEVTASRYLQTASEALSPISLILTKQIAERGYEQLEDALRDVPGIDMIHLNGYAPTLICHWYNGRIWMENEEKGTSFFFHCR